MANPPDDAPAASYATLLPRAALPLPARMFDACPIQASLGVLGRRWALLVLRDISWFPGIRFSDLLRTNKGLTPRVLAFRLKELRTEGFIERAPGANGREVAYRLTRKGQDAVPILAAFIQFGAKHHAGTVFTDGRPRSMRQLFPGGQRELLGATLAFAEDRPKGPRRG